MIDTDGFRANVGIILANTQGQVLWTKRVGHNSWQFPQGGLTMVKRQQMRCIVSYGRRLVFVLAM